MTNFYFNVDSAVDDHNSKIFSIKWFTSDYFLHHHEFLFFNFEKISEFN